MPTAEELLEERNRMAGHLRIAAKELERYNAALNDYQFQMLDYDRRNDEMRGALRLLLSSLLDAYTLRDWEPVGEVINSLRDITEERLKILKREGEQNVD